MEKNPLLLLFGIMSIFFILVTVITIFRKQIIFARANLLFSIISLSAFALVYLGIADVFTNASPRNKNHASTSAIQNKQEPYITKQPLPGSKITFDDLQIGPYHTLMTSSDVQNITGRPPDKSYVNEDNYYVSDWNSEVIITEREHSARVTSLLFVDDSLDYQTPRGITIGDSLEEVQKAYGYQQYDPNEKILGYYQDISDTHSAYIAFEFLTEGFVTAIYIRHDLK